MSTYFKVKYLGGHPELSRPCDINIEVNRIRNYLKITECGMFASTDIRIPFEKIRHISFDEKSKRSLGKAATGAIIGGILTGGIGAIAGGAIGGKRKDDSNHYITIEYRNSNFDVIVKPGKDSQRLYADIICCFSGV